MEDVIALFEYMIIVEQIEVTFDDEEEGVDPAQRFPRLVHFLVHFEPVL